MTKHLFLPLPKSQFLTLDDSPHLKYINVNEVLHFQPQYNTDFRVYDVENAPALVRFSKANQIKSFIILAVIRRSV